MTDEEYLQYCRELLQEFSLALSERAEHLPDSDPLRELSAAYSELASGTMNLYEEGPGLVALGREISRRQRRRFP